MWHVVEVLDGQVKGIRSYNEPKDAEVDAINTACDGLEDDDIDDEWAAKEIETRKARILRTGVWSDGSLLVRIIEGEVS